MRIIWFVKTHFDFIAKALKFFLSLVCLIKISWELNFLSFFFLWFVCLSFIFRVFLSAMVNVEENNLPKQERETNRQIKMCLFI